jgi:hypothetical protein
MKILKYINFAVLGLAALVSVLFYANLAGPDALLYFSYILTAVALIGVAGFYIYSVVEHPKQIKFVALLAVAAALLIIVCYYLATPTAVGLDPELERTTSGTAIRWSEAGIYSMYILFVGAFITILVGGVRNMFK